MKRAVSFSIILALAMSLTGTLVAAKSFLVTEIHGKVLTKGATLSRGATITDNDVLSSSQQSIIKITDKQKSFTLKLKGSKSVKQLISAIPNKYESAIESIRHNLDKNGKKKVEYGMVTMGAEKLPYDLRENEAVALCKEDSLGGISVTFMRYGMEHPVMYQIKPTTYNYLLRMDIITAKGLEYAYSTTAIYNVLWKPMEQYLKPGDTLIYTIPLFLSDIEMDNIKVNDDGSTLSSLYDLLQLDNY